MSVVNNAALSTTILAGGAVLDSNGWHHDLQQSADRCAGPLTKSGAGTVALNGANTYAGNTVVGVGTLKLGHATALGTTAGTTSVTSGAVLDLDGQTVGARGDPERNGKFLRWSAHQQ
ncbi:MAG: autotransporter-associated beta strand repeat-containing protein [Kiritimatiellia bacterium]